MTSLSARFPRVRLVLAALAAFAVTIALLVALRASADTQPTARPAAAKQDHAGSRWSRPVEVAGRRWSRPVEVAGRRWSKPVEVAGGLEPYRSRWS